MNNLDSETLKVNQYIFAHKKEFNIEIGQKIKHIRQKKKISKAKFADRSMMSPTYISQIEEGTNGITLNKFVIICNALEVESKELLDEFLYGSKTNEDILYRELQEDKNISKNISNYLKNKKVDIEE